MGMVEALFGGHSAREIKRIKPIQKLVLELEEKYRGMTDSELSGMTPIFKERIANGESLDDLLPDAFAAVREAADRVLNMRHFPVQIIGGIVLHQGRISEMKTGEGKTLVATLPAYLNALEGKGVHIVTVNDYLARRDSEWMGKVYNFMGLSVGLIVHDIDPDTRQKAYNSDITYGTNNEFGFDYLRDNMVTYKEQMSQRGHRYAIVDEVDSILVDEARTPLIISGQGDKSTQLYDLADKFAKNLSLIKVRELDDKESHDDYDADYLVDEKAKSVTLTPRGVKKAETHFNVKNLMDAENIELQHHINQAIRARGLMKRDVDYVVKDGEVIIVDEFTGRLMFGRRYNEGLHQAIEAKEGVKVERESQTLATITFQNYFRLYDKLSGMTGTALTEQQEFQEIYSLDCIEIPTNQPMIRNDHHDLVYKTESGKFSSVINQIEECNKKGQPVLAGTVSIENSEKLSALLKRRGIKHEVLNAKFHEKEAEIISQAGKRGAVTIATNMAGRGTDIVLGGNAEFSAKFDMRKAGYTEELITQANAFGETEDEAILEARAKFTELLAKYKAEFKPEIEAVISAGGLFIIGTERHESRRIDNQLRGRAGRQGDPGESCFYISLEDDLMRLFGGERIQGLMETLGIEEDMPIENGMLTKSIENAQKKVEGRNFGIRKDVLKYDDVMNRQREVIYTQRKKVLDGLNLHDNIQKMIEDTLHREVNRFIAADSNADDWNVEGLRDVFLGWLTDENSFKFTHEQLSVIVREDIYEILHDKATELYTAKEEALGADVMRELERVVLLRSVDTKWIEHIDAMEELRRGIHLRAYGQRDPATEYRIEGSNMFDDMIGSIQEEVARLIILVQIRNEEEPKREQVAKPMTQSIGDEPQEKKQPVKKAAKPGRNDPCPCGSGKKYKKCCGLEE